MLMCRVDAMLVPGRTPFIYASVYGRLPVVKHLVEHKANIDAKDVFGMFLDSALPEFCFRLYVFVFACVCGCCECDASFQAKLP